MSAFDVAVGQAVREAREAAGISQGGLAEELKRYGFPTAHQTTVARIELGNRPLKLSEVEALSKALPTLDLLGPAVDAAEIHYHHGYQAALRDVRDAIGALS